MKINIKSSLVLIIVILIMFILTGITIYNKNDNFVIKVGNQKIYKGEFMLYLYEQKKYFESTGGLDIWDTPFGTVSAKDVAKSSAISNAIFIKMVSNKSTTLGISLSDDEIRYINDKAKELLNEVSKVYTSYNITLEDCIKYVKDNILEFKVFDYLTNGYQINESGFQKYYSETMKDLEANYKNITLDYIYVEKSEQYNAKSLINKIFNEINQYTDFQKYSNQQNITVGVNVNLDNMDIEPALYDDIYKLDKGVISSILEGIKGFYIFKVKQIKDYSEEDVRRIQKEEYKSLEKNKIYSQQVDVWINSTNVERDVSEIDSVDILAN